MPSSSSDISAVVTPFRPTNREAAQILQWPAIALVVAAAAFLSACERPLIEPRKPTVEIVQPDLTTVIPDDSVELVVRADPIRSVESVSVDGLALTFDEDEQVWTQTIPLRRGLNRLILSVTDSDGQTVQDTAYAYQGVLRSTDDTLILPDGRGGHSATLLQDGSILVLGGSARYGSPARTDGALLPANESRFRPMIEQMLIGRVGHTATALPDGRVLIAGGSRNSLVNEIDDLIETVEIYDPLARRFSPVPLSGAPIRRAFHTAVLRRDGDAVILDLFGGEGDIQYTPSPLLGTRNDIRSFLFRSDSLIARSPAPGPNLGFSFAGHTQTRLDALPAGTAGKMLIAGLQDETNGVQGFAATIDYGVPNGLLPRETGAMIVPRTDHAAEQLRTGRVIVFGGRQGPPSTSLADPEIYVEEAERFFRFLQSSDSARRFGLTATKLPNQRILFLGGFSPAGEGVVFSEIFRMTAP